MSGQGSVLVTCGHLLRNYADFAHVLADAGLGVATPKLESQQFTADELIALLPGHDVIIAGDDDVSAAVLDSAPNLKAVIRWGIGTNNVDRPASERLGIPCYNTPGAFNEEVADLALGLTIAICRQIPQIHAQVSAGAWPRIEGTSLAGKTAGCVGLGGIGLATCRRLAACGMEVIGTDPRALPADVLAANGVAEQVSLEDLAARVDILVLACELTPENRHMVGEDLLARTRPGLRLVNVARGPLVDEAALVAALESGHVAAAALDVFEDEPMAQDNPLRQFDQCVFGSHGGSSTREAIARVNLKTVEMARDMLTGADLSAYNRVF